jgi:hypothetical protein
MEELRFQKNQKSKKREVLKASFIILFAILILMIQYNQITIIISIIFLILGLYLIYCSLKNKNTVFVSEKGILSSVNGMSLIKWEHIRDFEIKKAVNANVLVVNVSDTDKLLNEMNKVSKQLMSTNIKKLGSPVIIPESEFNNSLEEVKSKIENYKNSL